MRGLKRKAERSFRCFRKRAIMWFGSIAFGLIFFALTREPRPHASSLVAFDVVQGITWSCVTICALIALDTFRVARVRILETELTYDSLMYRRHYSKDDILAVGLGPKPTALRQWDRLHLKMKDGSTAWLDMLSYPPVKQDARYPDPEHGTAEDMVDYIEKWLVA